MAEEERKPPEQVKAHCPECGPGRWAEIVAEHKKHVSQGPVWEHTKYHVLRCAGCRTVYFQEVFIFSEDYDYDDETGEAVYNEKITYWPAPSKRKQPKWLSPIDFDDDVLYSILMETYTALDNDARMLAGTGIRTVIDRASELLGVDPAFTFQEKLAKLHELGKIGRDQQEHLTVLTEAGNASAHRAWMPSLEQLRVLMDIMEGFIYHGLVLPREVEGLKANIPPKPKRQPKPE